MRHLIRSLPLTLFLCGAAAAQSPPSATGADRAQAEKLLTTADEVIKEVEELRGSKFKREVKKGVHSEDELRTFIKKKILEEELGGGELERQQWMLGDLGLLPKGCDLAETLVKVLLSQVGGFYDPDRETFFMMEKAATYGEFANRMMIAHELTHALDDQYYGLGPMMKKYEKEHDAGFAFGSVVEGSATALMMRWSMRNVGKHDLSELKKVAEREAESSKALIEAPPYFATLVARYMVGMHFLTRGKGQMALARKSEAAEVDTAMQRVPASSEQILHPEKYWDDDERDEPVTIANASELETAIEALVGLKVVDRDTMGEVHCALLAQKARPLNMALVMQPSYWTNKAAKGWGGDRVFLLSGEGEVAKRGIVWLTFWDTEADAEEFAMAYDKHRAAGVEPGAAREGRLAVFTYGEAKPLAGRVLALCGELLRLVKGEKEFGRKD